MRSPPGGKGRQASQGLLIYTPANLFTFLTGAHGPRSDNDPCAWTLPVDER